MGLFTATILEDPPRIVIVQDDMQDTESAAPNAEDIHFKVTNEFIEEMFVREVWDNTREFSIPILNPHIAHYIERSIHVEGSWSDFDQVTAAAANPLIMATSEPEPAKSSKKSRAKKEAAFAE